MLNLRVLFCLILLIEVKFCEPQLDLPHVQPIEGPILDGPRVIVSHNSYTIDKFDDQPKSDTNNNRFDSDRSQRYGKKLISLNE